MPVSRLPLIRRWSEPDHPLPRRVIHGPAHPRPADAEPRADLATGPHGKPFELSSHMHCLCADIGARCEALRHLDVSQMLFDITQARSARTHGLQARVTVLRFPGGRLTQQRRGVTYQVQRYVVGLCDILYLVTFCLPRFLELDFGEKFITLFHELFHISPAFDGDLRRHKGRYCIHSHSQRRYDEHMARLARGYIANGADPALYAFLRLNFAQLLRRHGGVAGVTVPRPKIIPVPSAHNEA
jgi:predicted metallopeptidase